MGRSEARAAQSAVLRWAFRSVLPFVMVAAGAPVAAIAASPDPHWIQLKAGRFDPRRHPPPQHGFATRDAYPAGVRGAYLVQFERPIRGADRQALEALGASIGGYVPMRSLEVVMRTELRRDVESLPGVRWVGPYQASWKLAPGLLDAAAPRSGRLPLRVGLFAGAGEADLAQLRALGARVLRHERARSFSVADLTLPAARLVALAELPLVRHVQILPRRILHGDRARFYSGLAAVADDTFSAGLDPGLDGRDESSGFQLKYGHTDGGLWDDHPDFQVGIGNGWVSWEDPGADRVDDSGHGTHTAGILIGDGGSSLSVPAVPPASASVSALRWRGIQPQAALHHISSENGYSEREIFERHAEEGAHILSNSWGYADCSAGLCLTITDYDASAALWDEGVWDADDDAAGLQPLTVFFAAGNDALEFLDGCPLFGSGDIISSPATAKNVITVGASETDRGCGAGEGDHPGDVLFVSSRGPVDPDLSGQGLFKPDVTAVGGAFVISTERAGTGGFDSPSGFDDPSYCSDTGPSYRYEGGTSMACPVAAGAGGVLYQDLVTNLGVAAPRPSLIKALLVNGAEAIEPSGGCGYGFETTSGFISRGWGRVRADTSLYGPGGTPTQRNRGFEPESAANALATGESWQTTVQVEAGSPFKVTLAWTDHPASPGSGSPLVVNDLDLEVSGPDGTWWGNNFSDDWSQPTGISAVRDRYNVVENVFVQDPAGGSYTLTVRAEQVSQDQEPGAPGVEQGFSLVWSAPTPVAACANGSDDDGDGLADLADPGCADAFDESERSPLLPCDDGADNDADGRADYHPDPAAGDPGCAEPTWHREDPFCNDGVNNDPNQDAGIDFDGGLAAGLPPEQVGEPDPECLDRPWKDREADETSCGIGFELALLLPLLRWARRRRRG